VIDGWLRYDPGMPIEPPAPRIRRGTADDNAACAGVLAEAINDLLTRTGADRSELLDIGERWPRWQSFFEHVGATAAEFWVAEDGQGQLVGYGRSVDRDGSFELTEMFVRPGTQARGVGRQLLERAFPAGRGHPRIVIATWSVSALSRYLRAGVEVRFPVGTFFGPARAANGLRALDAEPLDLDRDLDDVNRIDLAVLGHRREQDHRWFAGEREGWRYVRDGRSVGYGYVGRPDADGAGPFAVLDPTDLVPLLVHVEDRRHALGAPDAAFEVPLHNGVAAQHLLGRGYRIDPFFTYVCSDVPFGQFDRYLFCSPALVL
jgi:GNAT superfamily N-acetyltransferase